MNPLGQPVAVFDIALALALAYLVGAAMTAATTKAPSHVAIKRRTLGWPLYWFYLAWKAQRRRRR